MSLTNVIKNKTLLFLFFLPLLIFNPLHAEETFTDIQWESGETKIKFVSNDSTFEQTSLFDVVPKKGIFSIKDSKVTLFTFDGQLLLTLETEYKDEKLKLIRGSEELVLKPAEPYSTTFSIVSILRGILGMTVLLLLGFFFSSKRKSIDWVQIGKAVGLQIILAVLLLQVPFVESVFEWIADKFVKVVDFSKEGGKFIFASLVTEKLEIPLINFLVMVVPTIIFFSALTSLLYFWGILQYIVKAFAW